MTASAVTTSVAATRSRALHQERRSCTRRSAATASRMSSSECAGESGSDRTSAPARSVTGSAGWCGASRSRYALSLCTGRKWIDVPMFSSVERALHLVAVWRTDPHDVEVVARARRADRGRPPRRRRGRRRPRRRARPGAPDLAVAVDLVELDERDRGEDVAEVRLVAGHGDVVERAVAAAHHPQVVERLCDVVAVRRDQPALARGDVLRRVEREARQVGDRADLAAAVARLRGVRGVLDDRQPELDELVEVGRLAVEVDRHDRLRSLVDELARRAPGSMFRLSSRTSAKTGVAPQWTITFAVDGQVIEVVITSSPGPDAERDQREVQGRRAGRHRQHVLRLEVVAHARLELGGAGAGRQPARAQRLARRPRPPLR